MDRINDTRDKIKCDFSSALTIPVVEMGDIEDGICTYRVPILDGIFSAKGRAMVDRWINGMNDLIKVQ